jgi:hypothetical protein
MIRAGAVSGKSGRRPAPGILCHVAQPLTPNAVFAHWKCGRDGAMIGK